MSDILTIQPLVAGSPSGLQRKVAFSAGGTLTQGGYETVGPGEIIRAHSGAALEITPYEKLRTTIRGSGWAPPGLDDLPRGGRYRVGMIHPLAQQSDGDAITPMRTARSDADPWAVAVMPSGAPRQTTLTDWAPAPVTGALYYLVYFLPQLDGIIRFAHQFDHARGRWDWTLDFEEK